MLSFVQVIFYLKVIRYLSKEIIIHKFVYIEVLVAIIKSKRVFDNKVLKQMLRT